MPAAKPPEFRRRAVELARLREQPIAKIAKDLGISESCLRRWMDQADIDEGRKEGLSSDERAELVRLRREVRVKEMEIEILKRASTPAGCSGIGCAPPDCSARWSGRLIGGPLNDRVVLVDPATRAARNRRTWDRRGPTNTRSLSRPTGR